MVFPKMSVYQSSCFVCLTGKESWYNFTSGKACTYKYEYIMFSSFNQRNDFHFFNYLLRWARLSVAGSLIFRWLTVRITEIVLDNGVVIQSFTDHFLPLDTFKKRNGILNWRVVSPPKGEACITFLWEVKLTGPLLSYLFWNSCLVL